MNRRQLLTGLGGAAAIWPLRALSLQQAPAFGAVREDGLQLRDPQIDELAQLAGACPDTRIVLNHFGTPLGIGDYTGKRQEVFPRWAASIKALAAHPNVFVKVGGIGMSAFNLGFTGAGASPSSEVLAVAARPYVETCIEAFGTSRCMFESNFPVDKAAFSYGVFWNACKRLAKGASATEKADLFTGTAARFYRLDVGR